MIFLLFEGHKGQTLASVIINALARSFSFVEIFYNVVTSGLIGYISLMIWKLADSLPFELS